MPIGGFNGSDPSPTVNQFMGYVSEGQIHWFIVCNLGGPGGSDTDSTSSQITDWVEQNFQSVTVDGVILYDLSAS